MLQGYTFHQLFFSAKFSKVARMFFKVAKKKVFSWFSNHQIVPFEISPNFSIGHVAKKCEGSSNIFIFIAFQ
jgi:hypothetical protein